ncbi:glycosyltransferase family 4 protein [Aridibaculum aurantiacum]|uniref:glycosyltransferase family 4 protein n=1 Tax=Aridibaculum aurantiacum TaxID=2810307 RepID=UPI001A97CA08|nr:glycosyltransferase family 4 protein [Aridibaculum aurantiacum]
MKRKIVYIDNFLTGHGHTPTTGIAVVKLLREEGFHVVHASSKKNKLLRLFHMLSTIVSNRQQAIVMIATYSTSAFYFAYACGKCCRLLNIPYITCLHGGNLPSRIARSKGLSASLFGNSITNVAVSGYLARSMKENGWPQLVIPNAISLKDYSFKERNHCNPKLLWVRSFHQIYNPQLAIQVLHKLLYEFPSATLTMVGPDKDGSMEACNLMAQQLGVEQKIKFTGRLSRLEWTTLGADHDIFINTSRFDNLPVSVIEAMALGLVVVSTNVGGLPFLIEDEVNGLLVENEKWEGFVSAIRKVVQNPQHASSLSKAARNTAAKFDEEQVRQQWRDLLNNMPLKN